MQNNKLKVNVTFQLEVPIRTDEVGRRLSLTDQVSPYISDYFANLQTQLHFVKFRGDTYNRGEENYDAQPALDFFERMGSCYKEEHLLDPESDEARIRWEKAKDLECWQLFKMTWKDFKTLSWTEQAKLREENGVVWENNAWVKKV